MKKKINRAINLQKESIAKFSVSKTKKHNLFGILAIVFSIALGTTAMANDVSMTADVISMTSTNASILYSTTDKHTNIFATKETADGSIQSSSSGHNAGVNNSKTNTSSTSSKKSHHKYVKPHGVNDINGKILFMGKPSPQPLSKGEGLSTAVE